VIFDQFKTANYGVRWFQEKSQGSSLRKKQLKLKVGFQVNYSLYSKGLRLEFTTILIFKYWK